MYHSWKVTKTTTGSAATLFIDKTKDIKVVTTTVTLPVHVSNEVRRVTIEQPDGTVLANAIGGRATSTKSSVVFSDQFFLPKINPEFVVNLLGAGNCDVTVTLIYEIIEVEN